MMIFSFVNKEFMDQHSNDRFLANIIATCSSFFQILNKL